MTFGHLVFVLLNPIIKGNVVVYKKNKYQVLLYDRVTEGIQAFCANHSIDEVFNTKFINLKESVQVGKLFQQKQQLEGDSQGFQTLLKLNSFYFLFSISGLLESEHNSLCKGWNNSKSLTFSAFQLMCLSN